MISILKSCFSVFTTAEDNRCTCFPNGDWLACCRAHDYDCADARGDPEALRLADIKLMFCVLRKGHPIVATTMYIGTRGYHRWLKYLNRD